MRDAVVVGVRCSLLLVTAMLLALAWEHYAGAETLMRHLPPYLKPNGVPPVYMRVQPIDVREQAWPIVRAAIAMSSGLIVCWLAFRLRAVPTWVALALAVLSTASINSSVAGIRGGWDALDRPFARTQLEYFGDVPKVQDDPLTFVRRYPAMNRELSLHAGTHPPGGVLFLWAGSKLFGDSITAASSLAIATSALAIAPTWWLAKLVGGRSLARRVIPISAAAPAMVVFGATSMDGVFTTAILLALAAGVWAIRQQSLWRAALAGVCLWIAAFFTFAAVVVPLVLGLATLVSRPRLKRYASLLLIGTAFVVMQIGAQVATGYDFVDAARAAMARDEHAVGTTGAQTNEEWLAISVNNLAAFGFGGGGVAITAGALLVIPVAVLRLRRQSSRFAVVVWTSLLVLSHSTLFTLETERVWMSMVPLLVIAAATFARDRASVILIALLAATQTILTEINCFTYW